MKMPGTCRELLQTRRCQAGAAHCEAQVLQGGTAIDNLGQVGITQRWQAEGELLETSRQQIQHWLRLLEPAQHQCSGELP